MYDLAAELVAKIPLIAVNNCLIESHGEQFLVYDDPLLWCVPTNGKSHFTINNNGRKTFSFLAIDKCCLDKSFPGKRCDFAIIMNDNAFILVEIKDTVNIKRKQKSNAVKQLESTILHFQSLALFVSIPNKSAIISWGHSPPKPAASSAIQSARLRFLKNYGFALFEGNSLDV